MTNRRPKHVVNVVGLKCPEPLMIVRNEVRQMKVGETVSVTATDPTTVRDFTKFCHYMGHQLVESKRANGRYQFVIRKGRKG